MSHNPQKKDNSRIFGDMASPETEQLARFGPPLHQIPPESRQGIQMLRNYLDMFDLLDEPQTRDLRFIDPRTDQEKTNGFPTGSNP